jgi:hypothetical protein
MDENGSRAQLALNISASKRVAELERLLALEMERRHQEEMRALLEGAPFIMHRGKDKMLRHVWVAIDRPKSLAMLRWQSNKGAQWRRVAPNLTKTQWAKFNYNEVSVKLVTSVTYGVSAAASEPAVKGTCID